MRVVTTSKGIYTASRSSGFSSDRQKTYARLLLKHPTGRSFEALAVPALQESPFARVNALTRELRSYVALHKPHWMLLAEVTHFVCIDLHGILNTGSVLDG